MPESVSVIVTDKVFGLGSFMDKYGVQFKIPMDCVRSFRRVVCLVSAGPYESANAPRQVYSSIGP